jgi:hypothetical protein
LDSQSLRQLLIVMFLLLKVAAWNRVQECPFDTRGTTGRCRMPTFTIVTEIDHGDQSDESIDFPHADAAIDDAQIALAEMARERLPNGKRAAFAVMVVDDAGDRIYVAEMHFVAKTKDDMIREEQQADAAAREVASRLGTVLPG